MSIKKLNKLINTLKILIQQLNKAIHELCYLIKGRISLY